MPIIQNKTTPTFFSLMMIDTKIAINPQIKMKMESNRKYFTTMGFEIGARYNKLNQYEGGHRTGKMDVVNVDASLYTNRRLHNNIDFGMGLSQHYYSNSCYRRNTDNSIKLFDADTSGFYSTLFGQFTIDSRDDVYLTNRGFYLNTTFSLLVNKSEFSNIIPIYHLRLSSVVPLNDEVSLLASFHHRTLFNIESQSSVYANYAANTYNSFSDYSFPVLGQRGISFLEPVSTLGELGFRIAMDDKNYLTPRVQALLQFDEWENISFDNLNWSAGITYQSRTRLGPIDFTIGYQHEYSDFNFFGGIGYQF